MNSHVAQRSIEALKQDFPNHEKVIEDIAENRELFMELATDYYTCKRNIQFAQYDHKIRIAEEYRYTLEQLKEEIETFLTNTNLK